MATDRVGVGVHGVPPDLKRELIARATERGLTMNNIAVEILAKAFDVDYDPAGRRAAGAAAASAAANDPSNSDVLLRMPRELDKQIEVAAAVREVSKRDLIVQTLAEALGTPFVRAPRAAAR